MKFFRSCDCMACRALCFLLSQAVQIELLHSAEERCDIKKNPYSAVLPHLTRDFFGYTSEFCSIRLCTWDTHEQCGTNSSNLGGTPPVMPEGFLKSPQSLDTNTEKRCLDGGCICRSWLILWPWVVLNTCRRWSILIQYLTYNQTACRTRRLDGHRCISRVSWIYL